ncbi:hypothetical protein [Ekhidna sp.]
MKKSIIASLFVIVLLSACKETETTTVDITGTATITGTVSADVDQTDGQSQSEILRGVPVRIFWSTEDIDIYDDGEDDRTQSITVTTDSTGVYTAEVPTTEDGIDFTLEFDEVELDVTFDNGTGTSTESVVFESDDATATVRIGETVTVDFDYESNFKGGLVLEKFGTISGTVVADTEQITTEGIPEVAVGATVTVKWEDGSGNDRSLSTTTDASGAYSFQVPTEDVDDDFTVVFEEFTTGVDYNDGFNNVTGFSATFEEGEEDDVELNAGDTEEVNFSYEDNLVDNLPIFATIEGEVEVRVNAIAGSEDENPVIGLVIRFTWNDKDNIQRGATATTDNNGRYSIQVPLTDDSTIDVVVPEIVITNYQFTNGGGDDVTGTATYDEVNATRNLSKGQEDTFDISDTTPNSVVEN